MILLCVVDEVSTLRYIEGESVGDWGLKSLAPDETKVDLMMWTRVKMDQRF